jgi:signal transduction histidine kinase
LDLQRDAYFFLSKIYERLGRQADATQATIKYLILKESLTNVELARQIEKLQFRLEIEKREFENAQLRADQRENEAVIKQQRLQNIFLVVVTGFASALFFIQWRHSKKRKEISDRLSKQNEEIAEQDEEIKKQNEKLARHNQELSELNHEKDTLMSIVVHDLKSPLNRIKGLAELIEMEDSLKENDKKYLDHIKDSTRAGLDLITDLLDVNSLEVNREARFSRLELKSFVEDRVNVFNHQATAKQTDVHIAGNVNVEITTDSDYFARIVDNLLSNAIKFSPKGSIINIDIHQQDGSFTVAIKDQGPGFSATDKKYLFQKFKKLSARPTGGESSNGLGLAIVKILVDRLGGEISLKSELGQGSEFTVTFPIDCSVTA